MPTIYVIRHAEKPETGVLGDNVRGADDPESLIPQGWQRAGALAVFFDTKGGLRTPNRIYASDDKKQKTPAGKIGSHSLRPIETITPLARKLGLKPLTTFTKGQEAALAKKITAEEGITLVCWQHEAIPAIATQIMGSANGIPNPWPGNRFDVVWRFRRKAKGKGWKFDQVCQRVLAGDSKKPIK